jgi:hypothetical protein
VPAVDSITTGGSGARKGTESNVGVFEFERAAAPAAMAVLV